ncbi:hypothetical protein Hdeb2414_s0024g00652141 [Helianthus debilis subsp. tardiflorus]
MQREKSERKKIAGIQIISLRWILLAIISALLLTSTSGPKAFLMALISYSDGPSAFS